MKVITKKFINYMKEQEDLERMGKTEQDFMIPLWWVKQMNIATLIGHQHLD